MQIDDTGMTQSAPASLPASGVSAKITDFGTATRMRQVRVKEIDVH
jgi:hypothetical protein